MNIKQLKYLVTVADEGSISAAAKKLFLSQPPLSTQLRELEEELGCVLFERGPRHITLTEPGKTLYGYAKTILDLSRVAKEEVVSSVNPERGTVRIGIVSSLVCARALKWISDFSEKYPEIDFEITEGNTYQLLELLKSGAIHLALIRTPYQKGKLDCFRIAEDRMVALGKPEYFRKATGVSLEELSKYPLIVYRRWESTLKAEFEDHGLSSHVHVLADDARTVVKSAELGLGVAIVPESAADVLNPKGTAVRRIVGCNLISAMEIVRPEDGYLPGCCKRFLDFLKAADAL